MSNPYKKWLLTVLLITLLAGFSGCSGGDATSPEEIYSQFRAITEASATAKGILDATEFLDGHIGSLGPDDASYMLLAYEDYLAQFINSDGDKNMVQQLSVYYDKEQGIIDESRIQDQGLLELLRAFQEGNINMVFRGGSYVLLIDYSALAAEYEPYILNALYDLYLLKGHGTENPVVENAALVVDHHQLAERSFQVEQLIKEHQQEPLIREDALYWYSYYNKFLLLGANNTPIFDYATGQFSPAAKRAYEEFGGDFPETTTAWLLGEYLAVVATQEYQRDYSNGEADQAFLAQCTQLIAEAEKRVYQ